MDDDKWIYSEGYYLNVSEFERAMQEARDRPLPPIERRILEKLGTDRPEIKDARMDELLNKA